jgi:quercetin dioxygenase-like cupin family protein
MRKVVSEDELPWKAMAQLPGGHPRDGGRARRIVHPETNGDPDNPFFIGVYEMDAGEYHPRHRHPTGSEFYYVLSGTGEFTVDDRVLRGGPGLAVYLPPGTSHSVRAAEPLRILYGFSPPDRSRVGHVWEE